MQPQLIRRPTQLHVSLMSVPKPFLACSPNSIPNPQPTPLLTRLLPSTNDTQRLTKPHANLAQHEAPADLLVNLLQEGDVDSRAEDHCRDGEDREVEDGGGSLAVGTGVEFYVEDGDVTV